MNLYFVGDIMVGRSFNYLENLSKVIPNTIKKLFQDGIVFGNLECSLTDSEQIYDPLKVFHFKLNTDKANILQPFSVLSLANNHTLDYGLKGLNETMNTLDELKIAHVGAGNNIYEASVPIYFKYGNLTMGVLGCADHPPSWSATHNQGGIFIIDPNSPQQVLAIIKEMKQKCDFIILMIHWGANWVDRIPKEHIKFAHAVVDAGVNILMGTSSHHVLPIEPYKGGLIFYGLGDFLDDYMIDPLYRNDIGMIIKVTIDDQGQIIEYRKYPTLIENMRVDFYK